MEMNYNFFSSKGISHRKVVNSSKDYKCCQEAGYLQLVFYESTASKKDLNPIKLYSSFLFLCIWSIILQTQTPLHDVYLG